MDRRRTLVLLGCALLLASPASASRGKRPKRLKVTTVVDRTVDGVVVERKVFLRSGGAARKGREVSADAKARAEARGTKVTDGPAELPKSLTLEGALVEKEGSYRKRKDGKRRSAVIHLVRPDAHRYSGEKGKRVYSGGRVRAVTRTPRPRQEEPVPVAEPAAAPVAVEQPAAPPPLYRMTGFRMMAWNRANRVWQETGGATLIGGPSSNRVHIQGQLNGRPIDWKVSRTAIEDALDIGEWETEVFRLGVHKGWLTVSLLDRPQQKIALRVQTIDRFLEETI